MMDVEDIEDSVAEIDEEQRRRDDVALMQMIDQPYIEYHLLAEMNREFIFWAFGCLRDAQISRNIKFSKVEFHDLQVYPGNALNIPCARKGLYLVYECRPEGNFPIYIGFTGTSFRQRFRQHMSDIGMLKGHFFDKDKNPKENMIMKVDLVPTNFAMHAKLLESVFLMSFDFPLNKSENKPEQREMNYTSPETDKRISRQYFDSTYIIVVNEINSVHNDYLTRIL